MTREEIYSVIKENISVVLDGVDVEKIDPNDSMADYGADSLQIVEVVSRSMRQMRIRIPRTELVNVKNLNGLIDAFEEAAKQESKVS